MEGLTVASSLAHPGHSARCTTISRYLFFLFYTPRSQVFTPSPRAIPGADINEEFLSKTCIDSLPCEYCPVLAVAASCCQKRRQLRATLHYATQTQNSQHRQLYRWRLGVILMYLNISNSSVGCFKATIRNYGAWPPLFAQRAVSPVILLLS